jgi:tetratricopeptide (TPR) repeat protein
MLLRIFAFMPALARNLRTPFALLVPFLLLFTATVWGAPARPQLQVTNYIITADLYPADNKLSATALVTFTALEDLTAPVFELNNGLQLTKVTDGFKKPLEAERLTTNSTVRFTLATPMPKGTSATWIFEYSGVLKGAETSPVEGIKLAAVEDPISILLYPGRWFPMVGLYTNRFTAEMHIRVPGDERVVGSGSGIAAPKSLAGNRTEYTFNWAKPGFPGTIIVGKFLEPITAPGINNIRIFVTEPRKAAAITLAQDAAKQFEFMTTTFGQPESGHINLVELPSDAVSATWAPEIAGIAAARVAGKTAFQSAVTDVQAGALAYDTEPLATVGRLDPFSPQFQSMTLEKGAMIFHMLRWEMGDEAFIKFLRGVLSQYTDKGVRASNLQTVADAQSQLQLTSFFAQWVDGTGAPTFSNKYTVFRLGSNKGFRTVGSIAQDLDLFRMPVELRIETDGKTETRRVDVTGTESQFSVETFGRPRRISIDPQNWLLKSTPDLAVRVAVLRGQQQVAQGDLTAGLIEYQKALDANKASSLAAYRIGEVFFMQRNYQSAANSFRDALRGDGDPKWVEVWSHIELGRIFDVTGQRDRAVNEYRLAVQTNDNTQGAINEARALMQKPYQREHTDN